MKEEQKINRRTFLKRAAVGTAAVTCSCIGLTYAGTLPPKINQPQFLGESMNNNRILVAYATRAGSTAEVAERISQQLTQQGFSVDLLPIKQVKALSGYRAVVVGSPIRMGKWVGEANQFLDEHQTVLSNLPTAAFTVCMPQGEDHQKAFNDYLTQIQMHLTPTLTGFFLGKMELAKLSFLDRLISKALKARDEDLRNWEKITSWAQDLPQKLSLN